MKDVSVDSNLHFSPGQCCLNYLSIRWKMIFVKLILKSNFWRFQNSVTSLGYLSKETVAYYIFASCRGIGTWGGMKDMFLPCTVWTSFDLHLWKIYSNIFLQNQPVSKSREQGLTRTSAKIKCTATILQTHGSCVLLWDKQEHGSVSF